MWWFRGQTSEEHGNGRENPGATWPFVRGPGLGKEVTVLQLSLPPRLLPEMQHDSGESVELEDLYSTPVLLLAQRKEEHPGQGQ